jgi:hypothetical protein
LPITAWVWIVRTEIAFIQIFILFLSHPLYAVAVVLTGFLLFAGIGSGVSSWFASRLAARSLVPWAWGVNGCASVLSAVLATLIAMSLGVSTVVLAASLLYAGAAAIFHQDAGG